MSKPGRNDPCYCGSGKKYKQCHMREDQAADREQRMRVEAARFLRIDIPRFARDERFDEAFDAALPIYWNNYYDAENATEMSQFEALRFIDWFVFDHQLEDDTRVIDLYQSDIGPKLSKHQQAILVDWIEAGAAWGYELLGYEGQTLQLREFMTGEEYKVFEAGGHGNVRVGEILLARLVNVFDHLEFSTFAAYLPKDEITDIGEKLAAAKEAAPEQSQTEFMRQHGIDFIHHALAEAEKAKRPPVERLNPNRTDPPIERKPGYDKNAVVRQRSYGATRQQSTQTRKKAI